jgi:exosortase K
VTLREDGPALAASLLLATGVKAAYSGIGPDGLRWMTAPTQAVVGLLSGIDFSYEAGYGYVNLPRRLVISKSCTGVNYLLAVFGLLTFTLLPAVAGQARKLLLVGTLVLCAFGVTVGVNALRITLGVVLHDGGFDWGWLTAERLHRLAGIVVYFLSLVGVHAVARLALRHANGGFQSISSIVIAPLMSYGLVAVAIPAANGALATRPHLFAEHCAWILAVTLPLAALLRHGLRRRHPDDFDPGTR